MAARAACARSARCLEHLGAPGTAQGGFAEDTSCSRPIVQRTICLLFKQTNKKTGEEYAKRMRGRSRDKVTRDSSVARGLLVRRSKLVLCPLPPAHSSGLAFGQCTCFQGPRVRDEHAMDLNALSCS